MVGEAKGKSNTNKTSLHAPLFPPSKQYHNKPDVCVIAFLQKKTSHITVFPSFLSHKSKQKKKGKEIPHDQFPPEGRREMTRNTICTEYKDCWIPRKKVYFQETKENESSHFTSDGSVSTAQIPDGGDQFFLLLFHTYKKGLHKALT